MEGVSGPSELELNKERLAVLKQEYHRLCYEIKKKESLHNSNDSKTQQQIKQQWSKIAELKKQKSEFTLQLRLQDSQSFSSKGSKNLEKFLKSVDEMVRLEDRVKKQSEEIEKYNHQIVEVDKKIRQKQKQVVQANRNKDRLLKCQKDISFLESRLNGSLVKYNQLLIANSGLREDIGSLLQTQSTFRKQYGHIKHLIALGKKTVAEVVHSATTSYQTGESVKYKLSVLKDRTQVDQKKLEEKIRDLQLLIEQDRQLKAFIEFKGKDRGSLSGTEELESNKEQIIEQKLQNYHSTLARIQSAAGCKDISRICKAFAQREETNANLFEKVNNLNVEIENLNEEVAKERADLETLSRHIKEQKRKDLAEKNEIDEITDKYRLDAQVLEDTTDAREEELEMVKRTLERIYQHLEIVSSQEVAFTVDAFVTDDNVLLYLETLERRVLDLIDFQRFLDKKQAHYYCEE